MNCAYQLAFSLFMALVDTIWELHEYFFKETWTKMFGKFSAYWLTALILSPYLPLPNT